MSQNEAQILFRFYSTFLDLRPKSTTYQEYVVRMMISAVIGIAFLAPVWASGQAGPQPTSPRSVPGEYLVKYRDYGMDSNRVYQKLQGKANLKAAFKTLNIYHISMKATNAADLQEGLDQISHDPDVEYIEPNYIMDKFDVQEQVATYTQSYAPTQVANAWGIESSIASKGKVVVAIIDTGLDKNHKVFKTVANGGTGALWINQAEANGTPGIDDDANGFVDDVNGWNFINNTANFYDDDKHGTHVAGIVVGTSTDIGTLPYTESSIQVMPLKFLDAQGSGSTANAIKAVYYAISNGAKVINNSWGGSGYSRALHEALSYAYSYKLTIVCAAGNYTKNNDSVAMYPANYDIPSNISVAATDTYDALASFSNYGYSTVSVAAPGVNINSTVPGVNTFSMLSGTSMASPFVAGLAALALREAPTLSGYQIKNLIMARGDSQNLLAGRVRTGARVNAYKTIQGALSMVGTASYQPGYSPDYNALELASNSGAAEPKAGGCGLISAAAALKGPGASGPGAPEGILAGLLALPLALWFALRRKSPEARRKHERFKMNSEVRVKVGERELIGSMNTISEGGLSFNADEALEKGGIVTLKIASPDGHELIEVQGAIVWSEANQAYGVQFANAREGTLAMIRDWTQGLVKT